MDQLMYASLSHTHYWYEVGMLKVPAILVDDYIYWNAYVYSNPARGQLNRENKYFPGARVRA